MYSYSIGCPKNAVVSVSMRATEGERCLLWMQSNPVLLFRLTGESACASLRSDAINTRNKQVLLKNTSDLYSQVCSTFPFIIFLLQSAHEQRHKNKQIL